LENFCKQSGFKPWLEDALNRIFCQSEASRVQAAGPGPAAEPHTIHCLCWCDKGTHRSVSACRVLAFVAGELKLASCPGCIIFSFFFNYTNPLPRTHSHHLSSHQWCVRGKCNMCEACCAPALATAKWPGIVRRVVNKWRRERFP
jgi:hypothetical protein